MQKPTTVAAYIEPELMTHFDPLGVHPHDIPTQGVFDEPVVQVCINSRWASHLTAGIERFLYRDAWRGTDEQIDAALESVRQVLAAFDAAEGKCTMNCCCNEPPPLTRVTSDGVFQSSTDGGQTWTNDPARDPRNQAPALPPQQTAVGEGRCTAANSIVAFLELAQAQFEQQLNTDASAAALTAIAVGLMLLLGVITAGASLIFTTALTLILVGLTANEFNAEFTEQKWQDTTCAIFCHLTVAGRVAQGEFTDLVNDVVDVYGGGSVGGIWIKGLLNSMGEGGVNNAAAIPSANTRSCDDCECEFEWIWDLRDPVDVLVVQHPVGHERGHWEEGVGWVADYYPDDDIRVADLQFIWGKSYNITHIIFYWQAENAGFSGIWKSDGTTSMAGFPTGDSISSGQWNFDGTNPATQTDRFFLGAVFRGTEAENQVAILRKIALVSTDKMSFGTGNPVRV